MSDESQITIPPSFMALFIEPGRLKPNASREVITARYEFCEDLASLLTEHARAMHADLRITELDVLERVALGLAEPAAGVNGAEADWVTRRLAELLHWD